MTFNYEKAEMDSLTNYGPYKIKLYDDAGNSTKWLTLDYDTFNAVRDALIAQGEKEVHARKGLACDTDNYLPCGCDADDYDCGHKY